MTLDTQLRSVMPGELEAVRVMTHRAVQHLGRAASANLPEQADGSHSSFHWDSSELAFLSQPMDGKIVGLSTAPLTLFVRDDDRRSAELALMAMSDQDVGLWLDKVLIDSGLTMASNYVQPFELPTDVVAMERYEDLQDDRHFVALTAWFDMAAKTLNDFAGAHAYLNPGPSPVRCWPHHFDIATYVALEAGDPETARGVGVGLSPGDDGYGEPYFYINPWPRLETDHLPDAVTPGHWHIQGYVGLIATATELLTTGDVLAASESFITQAFIISQKSLGH